VAETGASVHRTAIVIPVSTRGLRTRVVLILLVFHGGPAAGESPDAVSFLWREAEKIIGVPVLLPSTPTLPDITQGGVTFRPLGRGESSSTETYLRMYTEEFSKYPQSLARAVNLEWVAFVKGLKVFEDPRAATYLRHFAAGTMAPAGGMVYDVQQGALNETYVRWVLHHEFFHFIDDHLNRGIEDRAWARLNSKDFRYTGMESAGSGFLDHPQSGAITAYATKSISEDRAELFAALFVEKAQPRLREIADADPVVRSKIRLMARILVRIDPAMNERYFRRRFGAKWPALTREK
jgi:hypothetical protein